MKIKTTINTNSSPPLPSLSLSPSPTFSYATIIHVSTSLPPLPPPSSLSPTTPTTSTLVNSTSTNTLQPSSHTHEGNTFLHPSESFSLTSHLHNNNKWRCFKKKIDLPMTVETTRSNLLLRDKLRNHLHPHSFQSPLPFSTKSRTRPLNSNTFRFFNVNPSFLLHKLPQLLKKSKPRKPILSIGRGSRSRYKKRSSVEFGGKKIVRVEDLKRRNWEWGWKRKEGRRRRRKRKWKGIDRFSFGGG